MNYLAKNKVKDFIRGIPTSRAFRRFRRLARA